jgi:hypothetical protein
MLKSRRMLVATLFALLMVFSIAPAAWANDADIRIPLKGSAAFPNASGHAKYRDRGGEREFQVEVEDVKSLAGTTLSVFVDGVKVGTTKVNSFGVARFNRNTDRGQSVPVIRTGSTVKVRTSGGTLVVSGTF